MKKSSHNRRRGFTLMEVLLVLVIIVALGSMAVLAYGPIKKQADIKAAQGQIGLFKSPLSLYEMAVGDFPSTEEGLQALRVDPLDSSEESDWAGPYLDSEVPLDPWDNEYQYLCPGTHNVDSYDVWSLGPDGEDGTDDDIGNWTEE